MTAVESEVKLRVAHAEAARTLLRRAGAQMTRARHFEDNVLLDDPSGSIRGGGGVLRVRHVDDGGVLTFKGPREVIEGVKSRTEIETTLGDPKAAEALFLALGFRPIFRYQKYREVYTLDDVEVVVDETPIGAFLEIEGEIDAVHRAARTLGFDPADYVADSYAALFFASGGRGDMVFPPRG